MPASDVTMNYSKFVESRIATRIKTMGRLAVLRWAAQKMIEEAVEHNRLLVMHEYHGVEYDQQDLWKEQGDMRFYLEVITLYGGMPMHQIEMLNVQKLTDRGDYQDYLENRRIAEERNA